MQRSATDSELDSEAPLRLRNPTSPAFWLFLLGLAALAVTLYLVVAGARRTARTEERGDRLADTLMTAGVAMMPIDWTSPWQRAHLEARLLMLGASSGIFLDDVEVDPPSVAREFRLHNKHYAVVLRPSPRTEPPPDVASDAIDPIESLAWPRDSLGPGHAVFFYPGDAEPAYTRNLLHGYADDHETRRPVAGFSHRRNDPHRRPWDYRGLDDERWLLIDRPHGVRTTD